MSITVLSQLVDAEVLLSEQEAVLMQQLVEIQEQRQGLQTVIAMFDNPVDNNGQSAAVTIVEGSVATEPAEVADIEAEAEAEAKTAEDTIAAKLAKVTKAKSTARKPKAAKASKKLDGRTARWQRYVLEGYRQQRLPDVVANVLRTKPKGSFKITAVMSAIFEDNMPKTQYLKARSRISNILSAGARDKEWYRGRGGTYSMSKKAVRN